MTAIRAMLLCWRKAMEQNPSVFIKFKAVVFNCPLLTSSSTMDTETITAGNLRLQNDMDGSISCLNGIFSLKIGNENHIYLIFLENSRFFSLMVNQWYVNDKFWLLIAFILKVTCCKTNIKTSGDIFRRKRTFVIIFFFFLMWDLFICARNSGRGCSCCTNTRDSHSLKQNFTN